MAQAPDNGNKDKNQNEETDPRVTDKYVFFHMCWLSQWHKAPMTINNVQYNCCEQYMMAQKAIVFKDDECLQEIMNTTDPAKHKATGRKIKNFKLDVWDKNKVQIIYDGNYAKFSQNKKLEKLLLSYGNRTFVEASQSDKIYGIGIGVRDKKADDPKNWKGQNLLGQVITQVRDKLVQQKADQNQK